MLLGYRVLISLAHVRTQPSLPVTGAVNGGKICGERSPFVSVENAYYRKSGKNERKCHNQARTRPGASQKPVVLTWVRMHGNILGKKEGGEGDGNNPDHWIQNPVIRIVILWKVRLQRLEG